MANSYYSRLYGNFKPVQKYNPPAKQVHFNWHAWEEVCSRLKAMDVDWSRIKIVKGN